MKHPQIIKTSFFVPNLLFLVLFFWCHLQGIAQGIYVDYGRNKVQHKDMEWRYYRTDEFDIYHYAGGRSLAEFIHIEGKNHLKHIEKLLDYRVGERLTLVIYNTFGEFEQTNIGFNYESYNTGGLTPIVGNQVFLYFDGDHFKFVERLRSGIAEVLLNEMLYGGSIQERIQNATLLNLPDWYYKSLIDFLGNEWSIEEDDELKSGIQSGRLTKFGRLTKQEKVLVGKAMWRYILETNNRSAIANIIYLTRVNRSIESGFLFVLGKSFDQVYYEWLNYCEQRYQETSRYGHADSIYKKPKVNRRKGKLTEVSYSPDGTKVAYALNKGGVIRAYIYDFEKNRTKRILRTGNRTELLTLDENYPVFAWHPLQGYLTVFYEKDGKPYKFNYEPEKNKKTGKTEVFKVNKVLSFSYSGDGRRGVAAAIADGRTDIYLYNPNSNSFLPITRDVFDNLDPRFTNNDEGIVFSSNRSTLEVQSRGRVDVTQEFNNNYDIFVYDLKNRSNRLRRITNTPLIDERMPDQYTTGDSLYSYLTDENGVLNLHAAYLDSSFVKTLVIAHYTDTTLDADTFEFSQPDKAAIRIGDREYKSLDFESLDTLVIYQDESTIYPQTNYGDNILHYQFDRRKGKIYQVFQFDGAYRFGYSNKPEYPSQEEVKPVNTKMKAEQAFFRQKRTINENVSRTGTPKEEKLKEKEAQEKEKQKEREKAQADRKPPRFTFQHYFEEEYKDSALIAQEEEMAEREKLEREKRRFGPTNMYFASFTPDFVVTQLDNGIINSPYFPYNEGENFVHTPFMNVMLEGGVSDLFQDYRFSGGVRFLANLQGAEYFVNAVNYKKRLNKELLFFRRGIRSEGENFQFNRTLTNELRNTYTWPFSRNLAVRGAVFGRMDRRITLSSNDRTLRTPDANQYYVGGKFELIYDNSIETGVNLRSGNRMKIYTEHFNEVRRTAEGFDASFNVIGGDLRKYVHLYKGMTLAGRMAFATSFGSSKVVYFMGGVDNELFPSYNEDIRVSQSENYAFKTLATNMRGFDQNIRNGNSYGVLNMELRLPLFMVLQNQPIRSNFVENFQLVGFFDYGTAWTGSSPYSEDNNLNKRVIDRESIRVTVINVIDPFVYGYGVGVRSKLLGYFVRLDYAWGVQNQVVNSGSFYFSLGYDF